ncbi:hypothetical protein EC991_006567 [Linnemannia zychae]|nr:hypothetical protein EC991_006567 [Linnemannia zychae]
MSTKQSPPQLLIFEIPHIQDDICAYLTRESLVRSTLVSRTWRDLFTPYLYRTIDLTHNRTLAHFKLQGYDGDDDSGSCPAVTALLRYRGHVQTLKVSAINKVFLTLLRSLPDAPRDVVSVSSLPKSMRTALESWRFVNLRHFEWTATKGPDTSSTSYDPNIYENDDGSMTALQLLVLNIEHLETVSLKFKSLNRQHVRVMKGLLRRGAGGGHQAVRLRKLYVAYRHADVFQSVMRRFTWAALSLYKPLLTNSYNDANDEDDKSGQTVKTTTTTTTMKLDTFSLTWDRDGEYGWNDYESDSDSDTESDGDDNGDERDDDFEELGGDSKAGNEHSGTTTQGSSSSLANLGNVSTSSSPRKSPIKHLAFGLDRAGIYILRLQPLLKRCPDLESLSLWKVDSSQMLYELSGLLRRFCPRFKSLGLGVMDAGERGVEHLLVACSGKMTLTTDVVTERRREGLESFRILAQNDIGEISTLALGKYHGDSLESLDFAQQTRFPAHLFLQLLKHCRRLRVLKCNIEFCMEYEGQIIDYSTLFSVSTPTDTPTTGNASNDSGWPFASTLTFLDLTVYRGSDLEIDSNFRHGDGSISDQFIAYLYTQLARLTRLQEWHLGGWMVLLRIGWGLEMLSGLKSLKVLDVREHTFVRWTEEDVTWMAENWTGLLEIWGVKGPHLQPVVQRLKALRPTIEIL